MADKQDFLAIEFLKNPFMDFEMLEKLNDAHKFKNKKADGGNNLDENHVESPGKNGRAESKIDVAPLTKKNL